MTGELSLTGRVLPIGGLPEKLMAADRAGIRKVLIPKDNVRDLDDVPEEVRSKLEITAVDNAKEVIRQALGITDIFDAGKSDFTPLTDSMDDIYLSTAEQSTRVLIDEEGCKAASVTVMMWECASASMDHMTFILDRPFVFEIMSDSGLPLFVGVVNHPAA